MSQEPSAEVGPDEEDRPLSTFRSFATLHLHFAARALERYTEAYYRREFGLKLAECRVIGITASYGIATFRQICDDGDFEKSYASRLINTLATQGLVDKKWSQVDQRSVSVTLTRAGRAMHRRLHAAAGEIDARWTSVIPEAERAILLRNLDALTASARNLSANEPAQPDAEAAANPTVRAIRSRG
jgi:DNA-binding MarR family transcriptional regulator